MVGETVITIVGNLTDDPELRLTSDGTTVAHFAVASTPRRYDREAKEWRDAETLFLRCSAWQQTADHVAQSLTRGTRVLVQGRLRQRTYETTNGERRTVVECEVDEIGPSLRFATARVAKTSRTGVLAGARPSDGVPLTRHDGGEPSAPWEDEEPF
jgi:single-strand DNA-binding protein